MENSDTKKYYINTYGCQMNVHESEKIAGVLCEKGYTACQRFEDADILVFNTCCVRETAENKIYGHLGLAKNLKEGKKNLKIVLCGCMAQKPDELATLRRRLPHVDLIIGTHNLFLLGEYLDKLQNGRIFEVWDDARINSYDFSTASQTTALRDSNLSAFVNIMQGCDNFCSYCIVPYVRGRERSRPAQQVLSEVEGLIKSGYKEITLLGQNVNSYGADGKAGADFCGLLQLIDGLDVRDKDSRPAKFKIKFMTSHPKDLSESVIKTIANGKNLAKYIHLPVQSGNNRILSLMNRPYTREQYLNLVQTIRSFIPDCGLSSDLMVGFPTETDSEFLDSLRLVQEVRFGNLFTFIYNRRSGTAADLMDGQIAESVKSERIEKIIALQAKIGAEDAAACVGKQFEVLCEKVEDGFGYGKSWQDRPVRFAAASDLTGQFLDIKITDHQNTKLTGEIV